MSQSTLVKSTVILTIATLLSKILGSIFRVPLQNIAGDEVLGIFTAVYPVYMVALYLSVAGIPLAISKLIAEANARKAPQQVKKIYMTASILAICFGLFSFTVIFSFSNILAQALGGPSTRFALIIVALTLLVA
ncbi:MAG: oligosaccharide flippase family protein, partial [Solibacillus sp.]